MILTKFEHACLVLEEQGQKLIIDAGIFSKSCKDFTNISGVIVTHDHPDHFDPIKLAEIVRQNPKVQIFTTQIVANEIKNLPTIVARNGQKLTVGTFVLEFFGKDHATIHSSYPATQNIGVMVNNKLYYAGDALTLPNIPVKTLAVPASAPWLKIGDAIDFITAIKPQRVFPTHNALLSEIGAGINDRILEAATKNVEAEYIKISPNTSISL